MRSRSLQPEIFDLRPPEPGELERVYGCMQRTNALSAAARSVWTFMAPRIRGRRGPIEVLEVAAGAADLSRALVAQARAAGVELHATALDKEPRVAAFAAQLGKSRGIRCVAGDLFRPPFSPHAFDFVVGGMFLHHLSDTDVVRALRAIVGLARRGVAVTDLRRSRLAYAVARVVTLGAHPTARHDGPLSVKKAFTHGELAALLGRSGLGGLSVTRAFPFRLLVCGETTPA